jgi:hypothetical protein
MTALRASQLTGSTRHGRSAAKIAISGTGHAGTAAAVTAAAATARMPRPGPCDLAGALLPRIVQRAYELVGFGTGSGWQVISHLASALRGGSLPVSR